MTDTADTVVLGPYNARVRAYFKNPLHAAPGSASDGQVFEARVCEPGAGARIFLRAVADNGVLTRVCFRVFGCPHLIAAAEACCERFEGGLVNQLSEFSVSDIMQTLGVPIEKTGRILLLEDAFRSLHSQMVEAA